MTISSQFAPPSIEVHPYLKEGQEFTIPIEQWNALSPLDKSKFLGNNRLLLMCYVKDQEQTVTEVTFCKHADTTLIKLDYFLN